MDKKTIDLKERKDIQLEMLKEIDAFCKANQIRYSLAFGTLLGAIRHQGFIPWDDDLDIMMPLPDMLKFKSLFKSETLKFCNVETETGYDLDFPRIANVNTYKLIGKGKKDYGVAIDLYVMVGIPEDPQERLRYFEKISVYERTRKRFIKWKRRIMSKLPIRTIPGFKRVMKRMQDHEYFSYDFSTCNTFYMIAGPVSIKDKCIYNHNIFAELEEHKFEDGLFPVIASYDEFLTLRYGDYMQLPPESERHPYHNADYYWV